MKQEHIKTTIFSTLVILSFFLGYIYAQREIILTEEENLSKAIYIDVGVTKKNITIKNSPENIFFRVNGNIIHTGSIDLKD